MWCWGDYAEVLRHGSYDQTRRSAAPVPGASVPTLVRGIPPIADLSVGDSSALAVGRDGSAWVLGGIARGAERIEGIDDATQAASGRSFHCVRRATGAVACFRDGSSIYALADFPTTPTPVEGLAGAKSIAAGDYAACAVDKADRVFCWGNHPPEATKQKERTDHWERAERVSGVEHARSLVLGTAHACALVGGGRVFCWGIESRLGIGVEDTLNGRPGYSSGYVRTGAADDPVASVKRRTAGVGMLVAVSIALLLAIARRVSRRGGNAWRLLPPAGASVVVGAGCVIGAAYARKPAFARLRVIGLLGILGHTLLGLATLGGRAPWDRRRNVEVSISAEGGRSRVTSRCRSDTIPLENRPFRDGTVPAVGPGMSLLSHRTIFAPVLALALSSVACVAEPVSDEVVDTDEAELITQGAIVDGSMELDAGCVDQETIDGPFLWKGGSRCTEVVVPMTFASSKAKHAWDIKLTGDARIHVLTSSIKVHNDGTPDLNGYGTRNLPGVNYVPDVDTVLFLYKKVGNRWRFVGKSDDGVAESKGSYLDRKGTKGTVFRAVVQIRNAPADTHIGLFIEPESTTGAFNEDS